MQSSDMRNLLALQHHSGHAMKLCRNPVKVCQNARMPHPPGPCKIAAPMLLKTIWLKFGFGTDFQIGADFCTSRLVFTFIICQDRIRQTMRPVFKNGFAQSFCWLNSKFSQQKNMSSNIGSSWSQSQRLRLIQSGIFI